MFGAVFCGVWCFAECELLSVELLSVELVIEHPEWMFRSVFSQDAVT